MKLREIITPSLNTQQLDEDWEENLQKAKDWAYDKLFKGDIPIMATAAAAATAGILIAKFPVLKVIEAALGGSFLIDHYSKLQELQNQYARYKAGDYKTELFGHVSQKEAEEIAKNTKEKLMGEMALSIGAMTKSSSKVFGFLSKLSGGIGKAAGGLIGGKAGAMIGSKAGIPFKAAAALAKLLEGGAKGAIFQGFLTTDFGKEFLNSTIMQSITTGTVHIASEVADQLVATLKSLGVELPNSIMPSDTGSSAQEPATTKPTTALGSNRVISDNPRWKSRPIKVSYDKNNKNIMYVNDIQITDAQGYQSTGDSMIKHIRDTARVANNIPDPTAGIPKKPGTRYEY